MIKHYGDISRQLQEVRKLKARIPRIMGTEAVNHFKNSFRIEAFEDDWSRPERWKARSGFDKNKKRRAILTKTARLKRSIRITTLGGNFVIVGTNVPYAKIHNEGGKVNVPVTKKMRRFFWAMYYQNKKSPEVAMRWKSLAITKRTSIQINMPKRQFMGESKFLDKKITDFLLKEFQKIFNNG